MGVWLEYAPWFAAMGVLMLVSAFCSAGEAALFYLGREERQRLASGGAGQRAAAALLAEPDRLLTSILFWNLLANVSFFAVASIAALRLERAGRAAEAGALTLASLVLLIIFGEMLPKSVAVLWARQLAPLLALPLGGAVRLAGPILPAFRLVYILSRRLLWPRFETEPYLHVGDLERAVELSTTNAALVEQEQAVLQNIVSLSEIRVDELMRPRTRLRAFRPPVSLADLGGRLPASGYLLVTERESDEIATALALHERWEIPAEHLEERAEPVVYIPWSTTVAEALEILQRERRRVAAVVNEFGETIGVLTLDDVFDTIFNRAASRSLRLLERAPIRQLSEGVWHVVGMTSLRRLARTFQVARPPAKSLTVAGVLQETLERFPRADDECDWGPFHLKVLDAPENGQIVAELTLREPGEEEPGVIWIALAMGLAGVLLSAFFSGAETGFYRATRIRLVLDALGGDRIARALLWLTNQPSLFIATTLVGNNIASYMVSLATVLAMQALAPDAGAWGQLAASILMAPVLFVYGELLPKNMFLHAPNRLLHRAGPLFLFFLVLFFPVSAALWMLNWVLARFVAASPERAQLLIARRELQRTLEEGHAAGIIHPAQRLLADGIFALAKEPVARFMTPIGQAPLARPSMTRAEVLALAARHALSTVAVAEEQGERLSGYLRVAELYIGAPDELGRLRPLPEIPDDDAHLDALMRMQTAKETLAQVIDATGRAIGVVSVQQLRRPLLRGGD